VPAMEIAAQAERYVSPPTPISRGPIRGCPECGSDRSVEIDLCDVCFAELGERDGAGSGPLFWDLDFAEYRFEAGSV